MKRLNLFLLLLLASAIFFLAGCRPARTAAAQGNLAPVEDEWQVAVNGNRAFVRRRVQMDAGTSPLVRGSAALNPSTLETALQQSGADQASCHLDDDGRQLTVTCRYEMALREQQVVLPDESFLSFLLDLPVDAARPVHIITEGEVNVPGMIAALPPRTQVRLDNGGYRQRHYGLASLSRLVVQEETYISPGQPPAATSPDMVSVPYQPRYLPRPSALLALVFALFVALFAVSRLLPVSARLPRQPHL